jgi:hypothetical protein
MAKKWQTKENCKEELKKLKIKANRTRKAQTQKLPLKLTPSNTLNASSPPYIDIIMFLLSTTRLERV